MRDRSSSLARAARRTADTAETLRVALAEALGGDPTLTVYAGEVTTAGRIELLPFLREQAISIERSASVARPLERARSSDARGVGGGGGAAAGASRHPVHVI